MDNFAVGASLGISNKELKQSTNAIISILNASGAYISAAGGHFLGELAPTLAILFAGMYLHILPLMNSFHGDDAIRSLPLQ